MYLCNLSATVARWETERGESPEVSGQVVQSTLAKQ